VAGGSRLWYNAFVQRLTRWQIVAVIIGVLVIGLVLVLKKPPQPTTNPIAKKETLTDKSVANLFKEAKEKFKQKKLAAAASLLKQLLTIKPDEKKAKQLLAKVNTALKQTESSNQSSSSQSDSNKSKSNKSSSKQNSSTNTNPTKENTQTPPLNKELSPLDILPVAIEGYQTLERRWDKEPQVAVAIYVPKEKSTAAEIERAILTAAKLNSKDDANIRLHLEKQMFPQEPQTENVNSHTAYVGLENPSAAPEFWQLRRGLTLAWAKDNWFFSVQIIASGTPSTEFKKGIAKYIATAFGY